MGRWDRWEGREGSPWQGTGDDRERGRRWRPGEERWGREGREDERWRQEQPRDEWWTRDARGERWRDPADERWRQEPRDEWSTREPMDERWRHEPGREAWREERRGEWWPHEGRDDRWARGGRPEQDRPWVERGPGRRGRSEGEGRGLVEWEDRGPLEWLGGRERDAGERPRGPKGYSRSDERIRDEVCERLARCGVDVGEVEVKVEGGEVTLSGTVTRREAKWRLEEVADDVYGVEEVHNALRVARPGSDRGDAGTLRQDDPHAAH